MEQRHRVMQATSDRVELPAGASVLSWHRKAQAAHPSVRILTYNVHGCVGLDGRLLPDRIAEVIATSDADVVCLQEVDAWRERSGRVHQAEMIAQLLGMRFLFFPAIKAENEQYGDAILSKHEMKLMRAGVLTRPRTSLEPRGAVWVEVAAGMRSWQVINTHLGLGRYERRAQARELSTWLADAAKRPPMVFCGDLNSRPGSVVHALLGSGLQEAQLAAHGLQRRTFSTWFKWVCLDYIYTTRDVTVSAADVIDTPLSRIASDHFPLYADLEVSSQTGTSVLEGAAE